MWKDTAASRQSSQKPLDLACKQKEMLKALTNAKDSSNGSLDVGVAGV